MKKIITILLFLLIPAGAGWSATGGPDTYGYTWADTENGDFTFTWTDISLSGTDSGVNFDDGAGDIFLPFSFPFYNLLLQLLYFFFRFIDKGFIFDGTEIDLDVV